MDAPREPRTGERPTTPGIGPPLDRPVTRADVVSEAAPTIDRIWRRHQRTRGLRLAAVVAGVAGLVALLTLNPLRDPQRALDVYAPGVRLDAPVAASAAARLGLRPTSVSPPPLAREFLDRTPPLLLAEGPPSEDGLGHVAVAVGPVPAPQNRLTSVARGATPVSRVAFAIPSPGVATRVEERLVSLYGRRFERRCFYEGTSTLFWPGNRHGGVLLVVPTGSTPERWGTPFAARLVLGARRWEAKYAREVKCRRD